ncbi:D-alanyl-D-alanine carboxypeptidase [Sulfitobacter sp. F26169L]|uniref:D-alanyl-D-alanine carboxypeptidase family protein n=1 Tax=Sulfitobacter sp. F26169L TaxID=2996015 RepID=UPI002260F0DC|nr:D-alanyl-D-alanine carboxypeptidase family protein [Sulfitobacter sp. F26169L]MCX7566044.1 D-alanyl-D-alanine carboxypeptidase [Sulfitobacter sp. F26169L]
MRGLKLTLSALALLASSVSAQAFDTRASSAYVMDFNTGTVLLAKEADVPLPPASMSKLMTLYMAFEALSLDTQGTFTLDTKLPVSQAAQAYGGSTMFLEAGERVTVEDLLRGIIVLSGNDACVVIAEALAGTEAAFARQMTMRAQQLGMTNSTFANSNGWPKAGHRMSMRDLGLIAAKLIRDYPQFYPMFAEKEFLYDPKQSANRMNRNPLLGLGIGADGLKTGHTQEAGYGLVGSAKQGDRRIIFVLSGLESAQARARESETVVNWAFRQFAQTDLGKAGTKIAEAEVAIGAEPTVGLVLGEDLSLLLPVNPMTPLKSEVVYSGPIKAKHAVKGEQIAELIITPEGLPETRVPLFADRTIAPHGFVARVLAAAKHVAARINPESVPESEAS